MTVDEIEYEIANGNMHAERAFTLMNQHLAAATKLCAIYFTIASEAIGEDKVRELRDLSIERLES